MNLILNEETQEMYVLYRISLLSENPYATSCNLEQRNKMINLSKKYPNEYAYFRSETYNCVAIY